MEDGNPNFLHDSTDLINMGKFRLITRSIQEIDTMKKLGYEGIIEPDLTIEKLILNTARIDNSEEQYQQSLICEPRQRRSDAIDKTKSNEGRRVSLPSKLKLTMDQLQQHNTKSDLIAARPAISGVNGSSQHSKVTKRTNTS